MRLVAALLFASLLTGCAAAGLSVKATVDLLSLIPTAGNIVETQIPELIESSE